MAYNIGNHKHLTLADRAAIEHGIRLRKLYTDRSEVKHKGFLYHLKGRWRHLIHVPHYQEPTEETPQNASSFISVKKKCMWQPPFLPVIML